MLIWAGRRTLFSSRGGFALSPIVWYHLSFSLSHLAKIHLPPAGIPVWVRTEEQLVYPSIVEAFLTDRPLPFQDQVLAFVRESWTMVHQITYLLSRSSLWYNKRFLGISGSG